MKCATNGDLEAEINTSSDQKQMPFSENLGAFHTIRPILTHSYLVNKWSTVAQLEIFLTLTDSES